MHSLNCTVFHQYDVPHLIFLPFLCWPIHFETNQSLFYLVCSLINPLLQPPNGWQAHDQKLSVNHHAANALKQLPAFRNESFLDRKSTRLNSSHVSISYAVFCLKKKKKQNTIKMSQSLVQL